MRPNPWLALLVFPLALAASPARAERSFDGCTGFIDALPAVITKQGVWCVRYDLGTPLASGSAITVNAHNVTIDCNGYMFNSYAADSSTAIGVKSVGRNVVTVRNCRIGGFHTAISLEGTGHAVIDNVIDNAYSTGISLRSSPGLIRGNRIVHIGFGTTSPLARAIYAVGDVDILDNDINQVYGTSSSRIVGVVSAEAQSNVIARNRVHGVENAGSGGISGLQVGIANALSRTVVHSNVVSATTSGSTGVGISCGSQTIFTLRNQVHGFTTAWSPACNSQNDVSGP